MTSKTKYIKVHGIAWWNDLYKPDDAFNALKYKMTLIVGQAAQNIIAKYQLKGDLKDHESGDKVYTFRRNAGQLIGKKWVSFAPPVIYDKDGKEICSYTLDGKPVTSIDGDYSYDQFTPTGPQPLIGHGSGVVCDVCVFGTGGFGNGARLQSIKIIDLIEYVPQAQDDEQQTPDVSAVNSKASPW